MESIVKFRWPIAAILAASICDSLTAYGQPTVNTISVEGGTIYEIHATIAVKGSEALGPVERAFLPTTEGAASATKSGDVTLLLRADSDTHRTATGSAYVIRQCDGFKVVLIGENGVDLCKHLNANTPANQFLGRIAKFDPV
jgi:hypothetical protein